MEKSMVKQQARQRPSLSRIFTVPGSSSFGGCATGLLRGFLGFSYSCLHSCFTPAILVPPSFVLP